MSNAIFPDLPGIVAERDATPEFDNIIRRGSSGRRFAVGKRLFPVWSYRLSVAVMREMEGAELSALQGFFLQRRGDLQSFLFQDREWNTVATPQTIGTGDGTNKTFRALVNRGGFVDRVGYVPALGLTVRVAGATTTAFTRDDNANFTFTTAPAAGQVVDWKGSYYSRVAFAKPSMTFTQFLKDLYSVQGVELVTTNE